MTAQNRPVNGEGVGREIDDRLRVEHSSTFHRLGTVKLFTDWVFGSLRREFALGVVEEGGGGGEGCQTACVCV